MNLRSPRRTASSAVVVGRMSLQRSHNRFSHRYIRIAEADGQVLGMATVVPAADIHNNADYRTVLSSWEQLRLQLAQRLILSRVLQHGYPSGTFYIANLAVYPEYRGKHCFYQRRYR